MNIYVDADTCPVKEEIIHIAQEKQTIASFIGKKRMFFSLGKERAYYRWVLLDDDYYNVSKQLADQIRQYDIVITHDLKLASVALAKGATVMTYRGRMIHNENIDFLLYSKKAYNDRLSVQENTNITPIDQEDRVLFMAKLVEVIDFNTIKSVSV